MKNCPKCSRPLGFAVHEEDNLQISVQAKCPSCGLESSKFSIMSIDDVPLAYEACLRDMKSSIAQDGLYGGDSFDAIICRMADQFDDMMAEVCAQISCDECPFSKRNSKSRVYGRDMGVCCDNKGNLTALERNLGSFMRDLAKKV